MRLTAFLLALFLTTGGVVYGQEKAQPTSSEEKKPPTPAHTGIHALFRNLGEDYKHLWAVDNAIVALAGGGVALAVHPLDPTFNLHLRSHYTLVNDIYAPAKYYGDTPEQVALSLGTYAIGRVFDAPKASHLGMDLLRAQIIGESIIEPLKFAVGRERPDGSNHQSFPSGHSAVTFAAATVIERHLGWKRAALGYLIAGYVASSRLHDNVHYASDVVFGATVGTIAGLYGHAARPHDVDVGAGADARRLRVLRHTAVRAVTRPRSRRTRWRRSYCSRIFPLIVGEYQRSARRPMRSGRHSSL